MTDVFFTEISHEPKSAGEILLVELNGTVFCHNIKKL